MFPSMVDSFKEETRRLHRMSAEDRKHAIDSTTIRFAGEGLLFALGIVLFKLNDAPFSILILLLLVLLGCAAFLDLVYLKDVLRWKSRYNKVAFRLLYAELTNCKGGKPLEHFIFHKRTRNRKITRALLIACLELLVEEGLVTHARGAYRIAYGRHDEFAELTGMNKF
mgnify:CR=1 FL=1